MSPTRRQLTALAGSPALPAVAQARWPGESIRRVAGRAHSGAKVD